MSKPYSRWTMTHNFLSSPMLWSEKELQSATFNFFSFCFVFDSRHNSGYREEFMDFGHFEYLKQTEIAGSNRHHASMSPSTTFYTDMYSYAAFTFALMVSVFSWRSHHIFSMHHRPFTCAHVCIHLYATAKPLEHIIPSNGTYNFNLKHCTNDKLFQRLKFFDSIRAG